jgi:PAS domain S-box-containing protein
MGNRQDIFLATASKEYRSIFTVAHDITNRKLTAKALQESHQRFRLIAETIPDVFWIVDVDVRKTIYVSPACERIWGRSVEELYANPRAFVDAIHPDDREGVLAVFELQQEGVQYEHEYRVIQPDGSIAWILNRAFPVRDESGKVVLYTAVAKDITQRKQLEQSLRVHGEKLARSNEELERFAYVASHDLQEPLRMVASFTQLLSKRYSGRLDETADRYINFAVDGARRMQQSIAGLLSYSRVNSQELTLSRIDCEAAVQEAVRNLQAAIEGSNASVDWDPLPVLSVDQGQFTQLFQNLLGNSIKFTKKEQAPRIHISAADSGAEWLFSVQDNGIGIEPQHAERVFQVFQRLHTKEEFPGAGIGLAVCKTVVERHGGRIWMESEPGVGSTFRFTVPKNPKEGNGR